MMIYLHNHIAGLMGFFLMALLFIAGCDEEFEPVEDNADIPFSIFGYLDSPADTNWIRISEVRKNLFIDENATIDAVVTLEHLESGEMETLKDSLFRYEEDVYGFNFRTTMPMAPLQTYRITARRSDGQASSVTVTLPDTFPEPDVTVRSGDGHIIIEMVEIDILADVKVIYLEQNGLGRQFVFNHRYNAYATNDLPPFDSISGKWRASINTKPHREELSRISNLSNIKAYVYIASAGPDWIEFYSLNPLVGELAETSNVENGVGYVAGITSKTIPITFGE